MSRLNIRRDTMALIQRRGSTFATNQRRRSSVGGAGAFSSRTSFATSRYDLYSLEQTEVILGSDSTV